MQQITLMEKYPVYRLEVSKAETSLKSVDAILDYLEEKIITHPIAAYIGRFDHYAHTKSLSDGVIGDDIKAAKNIICCFGKHLPKAEVLAVRPRSIGVVELGESFFISFLEAPNPEANAAMEGWAKGIINL